MAVARGDAVVVTNDGRRHRRRHAGRLHHATATAAAGRARRRSAAKPATAERRRSARPPSGKLEKVEAFGNVSVRTATDTVTGDRGVYVPDTGIARLAGHVRITRGQNQLEWDRGRGQHEDRHLAPAVRQRASGCRAWWCRTTRPTSNCRTDHARAAARWPAQLAQPARQAEVSCHERHATGTRPGAARAARRRRAGGARRRQDLQEAPGGAERLDRRCAAARRSACSARTAPARPPPST